MLMLMQPCLCDAHNWRCHTGSGNALQLALIPNPSLDPEALTSGVGIADDP